MPSPSTICRTVVVLGYLVAVALAGGPGWGTAVAALGLVAVWLAPLLLTHVRHPGTQPVVAALVVQPGDAGMT
jgi:anti-sigma-K factor RskA